MRRYTLYDAPSDPQPPTDGAGADPEEVLAGLNPAQQEAASAVDGPVLIIAGPGSGKTRTLTHRIAYLLAAEKAQPWQILALTFTNKAAREMKERVLALVGPEQAKGLWMGTFHSVFARILRREADKLGYSRDFSIYDTSDSENVVKNAMGRLGIDTKRFTPRSVRQRISGAKNQLVYPQEYQRLASDPFEEIAAKVYERYNQALRRANAMDFDDLLLKPIELFQNHPDVLAEYQRKWRYVHIDEYQDTNHAQYQIAKLLAAQHKNLCVVGDDAQSIYAFRGADIQNILSFQKDYPDATTIRLEQNYRSTQKILKLADAVIRHNRDQLDKALWTENAEGEHVVLMEALSEKDEAQKVERRLRDLHVRHGVPFREAAILYRTNAQSRSLEDALRRGGIPYRIVGGLSFYQRKEIKDALAYLRLVVNPTDAASIRRVVNYPTRGIGAKTMERVEGYAREHGLTLWQALERADEAGVGRAAKAIEKFTFLISRHAAKAQTAPADEVARSLIQESGILSSLREENTVESLARWENVQELISAIAEFTTNQTTSDHTPTLSEFLQQVTLATDADEVETDENRVTLMTLHASKGLEFKVVFVTGMEEGLFPLAAAAQDPTELEEERRLFYVGVTRAQELLFLSYARSRYRFGEQQAGIRSRFLDEVEVDDVIRTETGRAFTGKKDRFSVGRGGTASFDGTDPHYYRRSLRGENGASGSGRRTRRPATSAPASSGGRQIVYDEGEAEIVPGVRVVHGTFGEGKVLAVEGRGDRASATVFFPEVGQKKLKLKFARLQVVG
ncbi:MAG: UvrD-helicase domain-containing protein [Rhodothermales bacterium]|nr:UvrD-helicase domain-containing protein [Rhodothermales bacterium]